MSTAAAALLAAGQAFHAGHFPATIKIGPQSYAAGTSGKRAGLELAEFGAHSKTGISFWLPLLAFTEAGQPLPAALSPLTCTAPAPLAGTYLIETALPDPAGATLVLRCTAPPQ